MDFPSGETVVVLRYLGGVADSHGNVTDSWDSVGVEIRGCAFDPGTSTEPAPGNRNSVVTTPQLFCRVGSAVTAMDHVRVRGQMYEVDGNPSDYVNPWTGWAPGRVVKLKQVTG